MPSWNELATTLEAQEESQRGPFLEEQVKAALKHIAALRGNRNVLMYGSAFLQKINAPPALTSIQTEDLNGFMSVIHGMDCRDPLTLIIHTPGGQLNGTESIVNYLLAKFDDIEVIVPAIAMSAGTMVALASNRVLMARHSQLGPIDPQMVAGNSVVSAQALLEQFEQAKDEISKNPNVGIAWAPMLTQIGPAGIVSAQRACKYSESMVADWLQLRMFAGRVDAEALARDVAEFFAESRNHLDHGKRIGIAVAANAGLVTEQLEENADLQDAVLTAYHWMTIMFEKTQVVRLVWGSNGKAWYKNWLPS